MSVAHAIDVHRIVPIGEALVRHRDDGVQMSSLRPQWWFVAELPLEGDELMLRVVRLDLRVDAGSLGVAFLGHDHATVTGEIQVDAMHDGVIELVRDVGTDPGSVVFRSIDPNDRPPVATVRSIWLA